MSSLSNNFDPDNSGAGKNTTFTNPDISFIELRNVVISINFINTIETSLLYHDRSPSNLFFCRLVKDSDFLTFRDKIGILDEHLDC